MGKILFVGVIFLFSCSKKKENPVEPIYTPLPVEGEVYNLVEDPARFPGAQFSSDGKSLLEYIAKNIKIPKEVTDKGDEEKVIVSLLIRKDGKIADVTMIRSQCESCTQEALRLSWGMPNWIPGKHKGEAVNSFFTLPIIFKP